MSKGPKPGESADDYVARRMADENGNKHLKVLLAKHMLPGEEIVLWAPAFRIGTTFEGIAVLTAKRLIFFRTGTLGDKLEPIPIDKVSTVEASRGIMFLDATIYASNDSLKLRFVLKPRGEELLLALQAAMHAPQTDAAPLSTEGSFENQSVDRIMAQIVKLGELRDAGLLTDNEFTAKKSELLARI